MEGIDIKQIGFDFDGVIVKLPYPLQRISNRLPWWLSGALNFLIGQPDEEILGIVRKLKEKGYKIIIITSRPNFLKRRLREFFEKSLNSLNYDKTPCLEIICTGPIKRKLKKLKVMKEKGIQFLIDDDGGCRFFLKRNSVLAFSPESFNRLLLKNLGLEGS
ncbi:MAG: hypothetical protein ACKKMR_00755 [Candidatus Nealsonbacteria bacterium]